MEGTPGLTFVKTLHHDTYPAISPSLQDLSARTVLISGASRGIGRAMAISFTKAKISGICISARGDLSETKSAILSAAKEANIAPPKILTLKVDVTDQQSVEDSAKQFSETFPEGLDILINNAGTLEATKRIHESDPSDWWKSYEINVKGTYLVTRSFVPELLKKSSGLKTIVNVTSVGAHLVIPSMSSYNTGKLAICRFTEYLQAEYGSDGVIALSFHPGGVKTELSLSLPQAMHEFITETPELAADSVVWLTGTRKEFLGGVYVDTTWDMGEFEKRKEDIVKKGLLRVRLIE